MARRMKLTAKEFHYLKTLYEGDEFELERDDHGIVLEALGVAKFAEEQAPPAQAKLAAAVLAPASEPAAPPAEPPIPILTTESAAPLLGRDAPEEKKRYPRRDLPRK
jgi:hypothetical protein